MKHRKLLIITLIIALLMMTVPVAAQDGGEATPDPIDLIFAANDNLLAAGYFGFTASQTQTQNIYSGVGRRESNIERTTALEISNGQVQIDASGVPQQVALTVTQSDEQLVNAVSRTGATLAMETEFRYVDGQLYVKVNRVSGTLNERAIEAAPSSLRPQLGSNFLTGWVNVSSAPEQIASDFAYLTVEETGANLFDYLNVDALVGLGGGINFTREAVLNVDSVISEDPDVLIFSVQLDPNVMLANLDIASLVDSEQMTGDVDLLLQELFDGMTITQQIVLELDSEGNPMLTAVSTNLSADVTFSDGSEPVDSPPDATGGVALRLVLVTATAVEYSGVGREFVVDVPSPELQIATSCNEDSLQATFTITNRGANMVEPTAYTINREGAIPSEKELQLEAGTRLVETVRDGEFTLEIPAYEVSASVSCVREEATPEADTDTAS